MNMIHVWDDFRIMAMFQGLDFQGTIKNLGATHAFFLDIMKYPYLQ